MWRGPSLLRGEIRAEAADADLAPFESFITLIRSQCH
jgi:hypothetical protein